MPPVLEPRTLITSDEAAVAKAATSFDFIIDTVSAKHDLSQLLNMLKTHGQLIVVGAPSEPIPISVVSLLMKGRGDPGDA